MQTSRQRSSSDKSSATYLLPVKSSENYKRKDSFVIFQTFNTYDFSGDDVSQDDTYLH